jgi:hypothetical protein
MGARVTTLVATHGRNLVADVTAFRDWLPTADQAEARARCYIAGVDEGAYVRPFGLIATRPGPIARRMAGGGRDYHLDEGEFLLLFEDDAGDSTIEEEYLGHASDVGGIFTGILALAGMPGYLHIRELSLEESPRRSDESEDDDYMQTLFRVRWGAA